MASIPVTIVGVLTYSGLEVGGGPMPGGPGGPPVGIWPSPGHPAHPIAPGGPPPGIWPSPGHPAHPIAPGGPPLGIWGGAPPPYVDIGFPGSQPTPGWPPVAMPPIYYPPSGGGSPPGIWGPLPGFPTHPIVIPIPPGSKPPEPGDGLSPSNPIFIPGESGPGGVKQLVLVYVPGKGAVWFLVDVPTTGGQPPAPTHPIVEPPPPGGPKK
jgi:hypothetical protein